MIPALLAGAILLLSLLSAGCGSANFVDIPPVPKFPGVVATWGVNGDRTVANCSERGAFSVEQYPGGFYCAWGCAFLDGEPKSVKLDIDTESDHQHFTDPSTWHVYTGPCGSTVGCPTCP